MLGFKLESTHVNWKRVYVYFCLLKNYLG